MRTGVSVKVAALAVPVAVLAAIAGGGPFALVLAAIWALVAFCLGYAKNAEPKAGFRYHLSACGVRYLVPVGIATTFYVLLTLYISWFGDSLSIGWLIAMQRTFEGVSTFISENLKLSELEVFAILFGIYLLSCVLLSRRDTESTGTGFRTQLVSMLHRGLDGYGKYSGVLATGVATLASFTLFGMQLGAPTDDLQLRVKVAQQGYAEIAKRAEAELSQQVATGSTARSGTRSRRPTGTRSPCRTGSTRCSPASSNAPTRPGSGTG